MTQGTIIPQGYHPLLNINETQYALQLIRTEFQAALCHELNLSPVISPTIIEAGLGLQDDLSGKERPVEFDAPPANGKSIQILQDNCKWRRMYLSRHHFPKASGLYATLDAGIRRDEGVLDNTHSLIINNATWEVAIGMEDRHIATLKQYVRQSIKAIVQAQEKIRSVYPHLPAYIPENVYFISSQELEDLYPDLAIEQREYEISKIHKAVCILQIGYPLHSGKPHGNRSPDYDDWNLNFDIIVFYPVLDQAIEIGGGAIRVTATELERQIRIADWKQKCATPYHQSILDGSLIPTIGGAFGTDRICMILTGKVHIGEVRPSIWDDHTLTVCRQNNVELM